MLVSGATYLYIDTDLLQYYVQASELIDLGEWSSMVVYSRLQVVDYDGILYVALRTTSATPPSQPISEDWSMLVLVRGATTVVSAGSDWIARQLGLAALQMGWSGTYLANVAYEIGTNALYYAGSAYSIAVDGTNAAAAAQLTADSAFTIAVQGTDLALTAYTIAQEGTNTGTAALNFASAAFDIAVAGTDLAMTAYTIAQEGTNTGTAALNIASAAFDIAVAGTNLAQTAYQIATAGTDLAQTAYYIAQTGTNLAYVALQTAWAGTVISPLSSLPDVSIPTPSANQVLTFDGSLWKAQSAPTSVSNAAFTYYLAEGITFSGYESLLTVASPSGEDLDAAAVTASGSVLIRGYASGTLGRDTIDPGIWEFATYVEVDGQAQVEIQVFVYDGVTENLIITATTGTLSPGSILLDTTNYFAGSFSVNPSDRIIAKYYASTWVAGSVNVTLYHSGTEHYTHIHTPLATQHNDLAGLQGGGTAERYHTTLDQQGAMLGTSGYPSAFNRYVTAEDNRMALITVGTQTADEAFDIAAAGTNLAFTAYIISQYGTNTGTAAYLLAQAGTNAVITEQGTRSQADQFLQNQIIVEQGTRSEKDQILQDEIDDINARLGLGFSGTSVLFIGQIYGGIVDTQLVLVDGMVTGRTLPYYAWSDSILATDGSISSITDHFGWNSNGTVVVDSQSGTRIMADDFMTSYGVGTVTDAGGTLTGGTGFTAAPFIATGFIHVYGSETFEAYTVGTVIGTGVSGTLSAGTGWDGTIVIWTY